MQEAERNQEKNKEHYEALYKDYPVSNILYWINHLDKFLTAAIATETSWNAMYQDGFRQKMKGKKLLEMGCGDCTNAAVMAAL
ncbi:MAG: class I SAM-dependent methyltransferase, partial [Gillisia sp.]